MLIRPLADCVEIVAGDGTRLRELLHPDRDYTFGASYSLAWAKLPAGEKSHPHELTVDEVYYILSGGGEMHINGEAAKVSAGDAIDIPPQSVQWIENTGPDELVFLCIVSPAWQPEFERIQDK